MKKNRKPNLLKCGQVFLRFQAVAKLLLTCLSRFERIFLIIQQDSVDPNLVNKTKIIHRCTQINTDDILIKYSKCLFLQVLLNSKTSPKKSVFIYVYLWMNNSFKFGTTEIEKNCSTLIFSSSLVPGYLSLWWLILFNRLVLSNSSRA